jgi:hypothetical protein
MGKDPADIVAEGGAEALDRIIDAAVDDWTSFLGRLDEADTASDRAALVEEGCKLVAITHSETEREMMLKDLAAATGIGLKVLRNQVQEHTQPAPGPRSPSRPGAAASVSSERACVLVHRQHREVRADILRLLDETNAAAPAPRLYVRGGDKVRPYRDEDGVTLIRSVGVADLQLLATAEADFVAETGEGEFVQRMPHRDIWMQILADDGIAWPALRGVVQHPVMRPDGSILSGRGYDPTTRLLLEPDDALGDLQVPETPSDEEVAGAVALLDELIVDFPFGDETSRAAAFALLLAPFVRPAITGPTPLIWLTAPVPGAGKSKLAGLAGILTSGSPPPSQALPPSDEDADKLIVSILAGGARLVLLDNARAGREIDCPPLASALTTTEYAGRLLGQSLMIRHPNLAQWCLTSNAADLSPELARRTVRVHLLPQTERPEERSDFRHPDLEGWARDNRARLVAACLTLCRAWAAAGRPAGERRLGSFESWSDVVGGILGVAGVPGLLAPQSRAELQVASARDNELADLVTAWAERYGTSPVPVRDLVELADPTDGAGGPAGECLCPALFGDAGTVRSKSTRLGRSLRAAAGRVIQGYCIMPGPDGGPRRNRRTYALSRIDDEGGAARGPEVSPRFSSPNIGNVNNEKTTTCGGSPEDPRFLSTPRVCAPAPAHAHTCAEPGNILGSSGEERNDTTDNDLRVRGFGSEPRAEPRVLGDSEESCVRCKNRTATNETCGKPIRIADEVWCSRCHPGLAEED